jgi:hypothetical protein
MEEESKGGYTSRDVETSSADRPSVVKVTCEMLTKEGKHCRRKCVLGMTCCRQHLKWEGECSICLDEYPNWELKCGHRFHRKCFEKWKGTVRKLGCQGEDNDRLFNRTKVVEVKCPLCRSSESKFRVRGIEPFRWSENEFQVDGVEELSNVLQMLLPFPAQMIEQMAENLWRQLEDDTIEI